MLSACVSMWTESHKICKAWALINYVLPQYFRSYWLWLKKSNHRVKWVDISNQCQLEDSWNYMPPILVPSSTKLIATQMLVIEELNGRKDFILRGFVCDIIRPSKELPVQSNLLKHKNKVWKLFRIKNEDNSVVPVSLLLTVNIFQTCSNCWLWTGKRLPGSYWKDKHF